MSNQLGDFLGVEVADDRLRDNWEHIQDKLTLRRTRRQYARRLGAGAGSLCAIAAVGWVLWPRPDGSPVDRDRTQTRASQIELPDGTQMELEPDSRISRCGEPRNDACVRLERGQARFQIKPGLGRRFTVLSGNVEVTVVGTRFVVERRNVSGDERTRVSVQEGKVGISVLGGAKRFLTAGQSWAEHVQEPPKKSKEPADSVAPVTQPVLAPASSKAHAKPIDDVVALRERARDARRSGRIHDEMRAYEEILARYPKTPDASLATFERARLWMDVLGEPLKAIADLERLADQRGPLAEDALARLLSAYARTDRTADCVRVRDRYLSQYPKGFHAARMGTACK